MQTITLKIEDQEDININLKEKDDLDPIELGKILDLSGKATPETQFEVGMRLWLLIANSPEDINKINAFWFKAIWAFVHQLDPIILEYYAELIEDKKKSIKKPKNSKSTWSKKK